ncbi:cupin domain-containing protein [Sinorhizobium medicae]|nr:cupin domain-containing protein [Sinorhizobium medicae]
MKIDWNSLPPAAGLRTGTVRKAVCGNLISAVFIENAGDTVFDGRLHWHENEQLMVILSGLCTIVVDGKEIEATPVHLVFVPSGARHGVVACGREGCSYYEIFAPARPDQLPGWVGKPVMHLD